MNIMNIKTLLLSGAAAICVGQYASAQAPGPAVPTTAAADSTSSDTVSIAASTGTGAEWALQQDQIKNDPNGQWAATATASSVYNDATGHDRFGAWQATGEPNVDQEGDNGNAWAPKTPDGGVEWINLGFSKPVAATGLRIRESAGAGTVIKVDLVDMQGTPHPLWSGKDPTKGINYFMLTFPKTQYKVDHVKITLATNLVPGWNEIDAVQLLGSDT